jgi:hypothetical protein
MSTTDELSWFKSSYSGSENDNCVEVAMLPAAVHIRDSKDKGIRPLVVTSAAWTAFTALATGDWFKSSYSGSEGDNCVEVALRPEAVRIRDSKDKGIGPLTVTPAAWTAFTALLDG